MTSIMVWPTDFRRYIRVYLVVTRCCTMEPCERSSEFRCELGLLPTQTVFHILVVWQRYGVASHTLCVWSPRYNIAPTQPLPSSGRIRHQETRRAASRFCSF